jgi:hypothetical protein
MELMSYRNMDYLHDNRIVYRRLPVEDATEVYEWGWYYENGTSEYYSLFNTKVKINSYKSLKWHLIVLYYLNQDMSPQRFYSLAEHIINPNNGFLTFNVDSGFLHNILEKVLEIDFTMPPNTKVRKIIFRDNTGLTASEKLSIVGSIIGRNKIVNNVDIYEAMLYLHDQKIKITMKNISGFLNVSERTIYRNMNDELKNEKSILNEALQQSKLHSI